MLILVGTVPTHSAVPTSNALPTSNVLPAGAERRSPTRTEIAAGIHLFRTAPYGDIGLDGNAVAIIGSNGVLVFDTNGTPAAAAAVLADIRKLTSQPVRYVVNSHWHWDHWYGTEVYTQAFPDVTVVAHEKTRAMMAGPAIEFNRPGLESQLPAYLASLEQRITKAEAVTPAPPELPRLKKALEDGRFFLEQKTAVRHTLPTLTFSRQLTLHLGDREVQVRHHDRAVTPGDAFLYLPKERIVITGDLLVNPISFALSSYPTGWLRTLQHIDGLDATLIVPGHGEPLTDKALLRATMGVFRELIAQGAAARARGLDPDAARAEILPSLRPLMLQITGDVPAANRAFEIQLVDWFLHRVYDELAGPLTDAIAPIPPK
ncbi:MAG: MBL fold metallo-hydrolase [Acidobacteriota bacterium]|nr:MBL fold metallo-hydrolase [Acidobacteriota bacterium]